MEQSVNTKGRVIIAGAGPGDPDLITVKAMRWLQQAEVVLTDRLVSDVILRQYVNSDAELIYVGKECRRGASTPQESINEWMIHYALRGKLVVRLKGGDVSVFSNILAELETLVVNNIPYEIVPGVTAALGAAAYAGIPLTARDHATAVRFLTYYRLDVVPDSSWKDLAATGDTLVFYMCAETLDGVIENLVHHGIHKEKQVAIIEQATTPMQRIHVSKVHEYHRQLQGLPLISPSLVIIGNTVALHEKFGWIANSNSRDPYFKSVASLEKHIKQNNQEEHVSRA